MMTEQEIREAIEIVGDGGLKKGGKMLMTNNKPKLNKERVEKEKIRDKRDWIWMPHPAHFICAYRCQFRLATYVGKYIVSTIGEMEYPKEIRKALGKKEKEWEDIGYDRKYETMVFKAKKSEHECCPYEIIVSQEVDFAGYNTAGEAYKGHLKMCRKWSN
jgi:hypothetical protein